MRFVMFWWGLDHQSRQAHLERTCRFGCWLLLRVPIWLDVFWHLGTGWQTDNFISLIDSEVLGRYSRKFIAHDSWLIADCDDCDDSSAVSVPFSQWIGWRENLQEKPMILMGTSMVSCRYFPLNQSMDSAAATRKGLEGPWFRLPWRTSETTNGAELDSVPPVVWGAQSRDCYYPLVNIQTAIENGHW